jgi:plastocyanin
MRKLAILLGALALTMLNGVSVGASPTTVAARGGEKFVPNALIQSTFRFSPGSIGVASGQTVTWTDEDMATDEPHTITVVAQSDVPTDVESVFECQADGNPCALALAGHLGAGTPVPVINVGATGLDAPGDSLLLFPGGSVSAVVSAPTGSTLYYLCALHPWMQGTISVG